MKRRFILHSYQLYISLSYFFIVKTIFNWTTLYFIVTNNFQLNNFIFHCYNNFQLTDFMFHCYKRFSIEQLYNSLLQTIFNWITFSFSFLTVDDQSDGCRRFGQVTLNDGLKKKTRRRECSLAPNIQPLPDLKRKKFFWNSLRSFELRFLI